MINYADSVFGSTFRPVFSRKIFAEINSTFGSVRPSHRRPCHHRDGTVQVSSSNSIFHLRRIEGWANSAKRVAGSRMYVRNPHFVYPLFEPSFLARSRQAQIRERVAGAVVLKSARHVTRQRQSTLTETYQRQSSAPAGLNGGRVAANFH